MQKIKLFELFAGIGAPRKALDNLEIPYKSVGYSEIDKYAIKSYCAIHNDSPKNNYGDITKINKLPDNVDILINGFPCQDVSIGGGQAGIVDGKTRSGLMFDSLRLIKDSKPKYVITENVKNLLSPKHKPQFNLYIDELKEIGYTSTYEVLKGSNFSIPQNRERVFIVSILNTNEPFNFNNIKEEKCPPLSDFLQMDLPMDKEYNQLTKEQQRKLDIQLDNLPDYNNNENYIVNIDASYKFVKKLKAKPINEPLGTITCRKAFGIVDGNKSFRFINSREMFRLMGFNDNDYDKTKNIVSESQLVNRAGNSIIVNIMESIFEELLKKGE